MSRELVRDQGVMMLLGTMRAEERLAAFLLNLSQRFVARGFSPNEFHLRMTRDEIGSYLGLSLETVSRLFSRFQEEGLITVQQKHIRILDVPGCAASWSTTTTERKGIMKAYKHILVPTDGSKLSLAAAKEAAALARVLKAKITALYVIPPWTPPIAVESSLLYAAAYDEDAYRKATESNARRRSTRSPTRRPRPR
jgi:hypothetical protein